MNEDEKKVRFNGNNKSLHPLEVKYGIEPKLTEEERKNPRWH